MNFAIQHGMDTEGERLVRVLEVQKRLSLGRAKVYAMIAAGELPSVRIGRSVRVPAGALDGWIKGRTR